MDEDEFEDLITNLGQESGDFVHISPSSIALSQLERLRGHVAKTGEDRSHWLDATRSLHLALIADLTEGLSGPMSVGALYKQQRSEAINRLHAGLADIPNGPVMHLRDLVDQAIKEGPWDTTLSLTASESKAVDRLILLRGRIDHPRVLLLSVPVPNFADLVVAVAPIVYRALLLAPHRYDQVGLDRARRLTGDAVEMAAKVLAGYLTDPNTPEKKA